MVKLESSRTDVICPHCGENQPDSGSFCHDADYDCTNCGKNFLVYLECVEFIYSTSKNE